MKRWIVIFLAAALCPVLSLSAFAAEGISWSQAAEAGNGEKRLYSYVEKTALEDAFQSLTERLQYQYEEYYTLEHFVYEVDQIRENGDSIDADLAITADMTLVRAPKHSLRQGAASKQAQMKQEDQSLCYQKTEPSSFLYTVRFPKNPDRTGVQFFSRDGGSEEMVSLTPLSSAQKVSETVSYADSVPGPSGSGRKGAAAHQVTYDRFAAQTYALNHAMDVPEFSKANKQGSDCANFVSKALHAGGFPYDRQGQWFPSENGLSAFCGVNWMRTGYYQNGGVVPYMVKKGYFYQQPKNTLVHVGSILYWNQSSHVALVTYSDGITLKYSQHSNRPLPEAAARNVVYQSENVSFYAPNPARVNIRERDASVLTNLSLSGTIPTLRYDDDQAKSYDLTQLSLAASDQYGELFPIDPSLCQWTLGRGDAAQITGSILTGLSEGEDTLTLSYPTGQTDKNGMPVFKTSRPLPIQVLARPKLSVLSCPSAVPVLREGECCDLAQIPIKAYDQYGGAMPVPQNLRWSCDSHPSLRANLDGTKLMVPIGQISDGATETLRVTVSLDSTEAIHADLIFNVRQQPFLQKLILSGPETLEVPFQGSVALADHFTIRGTDQYGEDIPVSPTWRCTDSTAISFKNGRIFPCRDQIAPEIYAIQTNTKGETISSKTVTITVPERRKIQTLQIHDVPSQVPCRTTLDLSRLTAVVYDQYGHAFTREELRAYPASLCWTLTDAAEEVTLHESMLYLGKQPGKISLLCSVVSAEGDRLAEQEVSILAEHSFVDVHQDAYYKSAADWAAEQGITEGITEDRFGPDLPCVRAQAAVFLWRAAGSPAPHQIKTSLTDVPIGSYYYQAVLWAEEQGITQGTSPTTFSPGAPCTRAQILTFLWRSQGQPAVKPSNHFTDISADAYYASAVNWAVSRQITSGITPSVFAPDSPCTRAQIVTFLYRMYC